MDDSSPRETGQPGWPSWHLPAGADPADFAARYALAHEVAAEAVTRAYLAWHEHHGVLPPDPDQSGEVERFVDRAWPAIAAVASVLMRDAEGQT